MLRYIEPRFELEDTIIYEELDEFLEIIMFMEGTFKCGFLFNQKYQFVMSFHSNQIGKSIGFYETTFHKRS